ncbi:hypothetical protein FG135_18665 [Vibrio cholerae]|uniref:hypothetical protein n=1 Tax=Vibrio TaxID=662 RepID=UPI0008519386|nr:hypothetical protein [Vibrio cholerae]EGQ8096961.1 hypothetical protein [Vibrio cholerae]EJL6880602.1 hypothetical protein [Vibrio cholerae]MBC9070253.1 hypothetical protein [Vibrio cholerae]MDA5323238.1 hypothetical protein [Vibrio cholerae]MDN6976211.1 hypothetical protein [Vibrio cholerae]
MSKIKESIETAFSDDDIERVDKNIESIKASLVTTNQQFSRYTLLMFMSLFSYHLVLIGQSQEITMLGLKLGSKDFIAKWFLIVPSILLLMQSLAGYLRVYQQESIEWLLAKYRKNEYESGLYRTAFPTSHILSLDLMKRLGTDISPKFIDIPATIMAFATVWLPSWYIVGAYVYCIDVYRGDWQIIVSSVISLFIIWQKTLIVRRSQEI